MRRNEQVRLASTNLNMQPDAHSMGVFKMLQDVYPAFQKKIFESNIFIERMILSEYNPMDIMDYPICGRCEVIALPDEPTYVQGKRVPRCTCKRCGMSTNNPVKFRQWVLDELKRKVPKNMNLEMELDMAIDQISLSMVRKAMLDFHDELKQQRQINEVLMRRQEEPDPVIRHVKQPTKIDGPYEVINEEDEME